MEYVKLGYLVDLKQGIAINSKSNHLVSKVETDLPLLRIADMPTKARVVFMNKQTPAKFIANKDDIIYTRTGKVGLVFRNQFGVVHNNCFRIIPFSEQILNKGYLYWYLKLKSIYNFVNSIASGVAQPDLPHTIFKKIKVWLPNLEVQKSISSVLDKYDELIENNNKRIKILEQMAENLYKEWFVRFRFPGYENAEFENGIPKRWAKEKISVYYNTTSGGTPSRNNMQYYENGTIPWLKTGELNDTIIMETEEHITEEAMKKSSAKYLPANVIAMAMYAGNNVGKLGYLDIEMTCSQACCVFMDRRNFSSKHYLFHYLRSIREYLQSISFGAAQQNISQDLIKKVNIIMPSDEIVKCFEKHIQTLYNQTKLLIKQNMNLIKQRDLLLPRLMSGKLEVVQRTADEPKAKIISFEEFVSKMGLAARAKSISDSDLRAMYEAYLDDDATE